MAPIPLFGPLPSEHSMLAAALFEFFVPVSIAVILARRTSVNDDPNPNAWPVAAFLAGIDNMGVGSVVVALLYHTVRE